MRRGEACRICFRLIIVNGEWECSYLEQYEIGKKKYKKVGYPLTTHPRNTPNDHGLQITKTTNRAVIMG